MTDYDDTFTPELTSTNIMSETIERFNPEITGTPYDNPDAEFNPELCREMNYNPPAPTPSGLTARKVLTWM